MYCICCKKNNVIPVDKTYTKKSIREMESEEDILWKKDKRPDGSLVTVNNEMLSDNGEPYFSKEYLEKHLGIKTCKNCGVKDFDFEYYCKSCERDNKINELIKNI